MYVAYFKCIQTEVVFTMTEMINWGVIVFFRIVSLAFNGLVPVSFAWVEAVVELIFNMTSVLRLNLLQNPEKLP